MKKKYTVELTYEVETTDIAEHLAHMTLMADIEKLILTQNEKTLGCFNITKCIKKTDDY